MAVKPRQLAAHCACLSRSSARHNSSALARPLAHSLSSAQLRPTRQLSAQATTRQSLALHRQFTTGAARRSNPASDTSPARAGPTAAYDEQVKQGIIQNDEHQRGIVSVLQEMYDQLEAYDPPEILPPPPPPPPSRFQAVSEWLFPGYDTQPLGFESPITKSALTLPPGIPPGLYLYGSVGCGKSYLMDLFYANLPEKFAASKRRIHFHAFMVDIHQRGHRFKMNTANKGGEQDWILHAAADLAKEARVLCFDEFQVSVKREGCGWVALSRTARVELTGWLGLAGNRHRGCDGLEATDGVPNALRSCLRHDFQVSQQPSQMEAAHGLELTFTRPQPCARRIVQKRNSARAVHPLH